MEKRQLGNTGFEITPIGLGAWAMGGGGWAFAWGPQDDEESLAAIHHALDLGINWIDTAAVYGLGHSEEVVARALAKLPSTRRPLVFTKCSLVWDEKGNITHSLEPASLRKELENSLRRLRAETIDLYQIHWPSWAPGPTSPDAGIEDAWRTLSGLQKQGKIRHLGVSNFDVTQLERIRAIAPVSSLQPPYSMLKRDIETRILPYCAVHNIGVIVYSPMHSGLLSGAMTRERIAGMPKDDWRRAQSPQFQEPKLTRNLKLVEQLRAIGARHGRSPGEVAIAWTLRLPSVTGAIVGARRPAQVDGFIGAAEFHLSTEEIEQIERALANHQSPD
ncbi:MAG: aldo/keto reductase [Acidobacteriia bacterium]|nr:aldo/keto reductase [Terriglobia bacterium]